VWCLQVCRPQRDAKRLAHPRRVRGGAFGLAEARGGAAPAEAVDVEALAVWREAPPPAPCAGASCAGAPARTPRPQYDPSCGRPSSRAASCSWRPHWPCPNHQRSGYADSTKCWKFSSSRTLPRLNATTASKAMFRLLYERVDDVAQDTPVALKRCYHPTDTVARPRWSAAPLRQNARQPPTS